MARSYKYTESNTGKVLFETTQPNHVAESDVDKMMEEKTGRHPRVERALINIEIRMVKDAK